jgi:hypothetical protein
MKNHAPATQRKFKDTQIFGWEAEPAEERESSFVNSIGSSTYSTTREPRRPVRSSGLLLAGALIIAFGVVALFVMRQVLRG